MVKTNKPIMQVRGLHKEFHGTEILHGIDLFIPPGEFTLITGPSGSGKTTLLNIMAGIERPTSGQVIYKGKDITRLSNKTLTDWRAQETGNVFQRSGLLGGLTARQNILVPHTLREKRMDRQWARELCGRLAIETLLDQPASGLSGGQKQRVAIARALVHKPDILFADEPTASLDTDSKRNVHEILRELVTAMDVTLAMVSHDQISEDYADQVVELRDGEVAADRFRVHH